MSVYVDWVLEGQEQFASTEGEVPQPDIPPPGEARTLTHPSPAHLLIPESSGSTYHGPRNYGNSRGRIDYAMSTPYIIYGVFQASDGMLVNAWLASTPTNILISLNDWTDIDLTASPPVEGERGTFGYLNPFSPAPTSYDDVSDNQALLDDETRLAPTAVGSVFLASSLNTDIGATIETYSYLYTAWAKWDTVTGQYFSTEYAENVQVMPTRWCGNPLGNARPHPPAGADATAGITAFGSPSIPLRVPLKHVSRGPPPAMPAPDPLFGEDGEVAPNGTVMSFAYSQEGDDTELIPQHEPPPAFLRPPK